MRVINARSVSDALSQGLHTLRVSHIKSPSRVGDVLVAPHPVMTVYSEPTNRVLLSPMRDANPFFHVMESLWMLAGRNDLPWLVRFNKRFETYSDDGGLTQPGAYGYRWRNHFGHDQLRDSILELTQNPQTRRAVLAMWDGGSRASWWDGQRRTEQVERLDEQPGDFYAAVNDSADVPCNTHAYFDTIDGRLNMTVCCRSNDIIWGAYGANAVHFSFLLEYMAAMTGLSMGVYRQFSNNYHIYTNVVAEDQMMIMARNVEGSDPYLVPETVNSFRKVPPAVPLRKMPLVENVEQFDEDIDLFMTVTRIGGEAHYSLGVDYANSFFNAVAMPMFHAYMAFKEKDYNVALDLAGTIRAEDWRKACVEWLQRRQIRAQQNQQRFTEVTSGAN